MVELRTLGTTEVRRDDGVGWQTVHIEPKRLALLVYLAVGHAGNSISRDSLLTLFWPELGEPAARSALRQALHHLATRLGSHALVGRGTNEIAVDLLRLRCDVLLFDVALDANEPARAMKLFLGEFLPGFSYAQISSEFLDWIDGERSRLKARAFDAALLLTEEEERRGNMTGQVHWLKRALDLEPFREDLLERIVDLYERDGNLGTAAQAIRNFSRTLRTRYGVSVSTATRQRLRELQREVVAGTGNEDAFRRMHALQQKVSAEMGRTADLMKQLQALTRPGPRDDEAPIDPQSIPRHLDETVARAPVKRSLTMTPPRDARYDIVALAASAGGIHALTRVISGLSEDIPAALVIVLHLDPDHRSHLSKILARATSVSVKEAEDGESLAKGNAYVAPPDHHLLANPDGTLSLTRTESVHFVRPSADLLFESVAASYGERAIAVVLSGSGVDGASGVRAIRKKGGVVLAQDEASSEFFGMPGAAIRTGKVNRVLPLDEIAPALVGLLGRRVSA